MLHRIVGRGVARHERGYDAGIVLYPVAVLLLIARRSGISCTIAAIGWALLGVRRRLRHARAAKRDAACAPLPWNRDKSWGGFLAFFVAGGAAALAVAYWLGLSRSRSSSLIAALAAAIAESLPAAASTTTSPFRSRPRSR